MTDFAPILSMLLVVLTATPAITRFTERARRPVPAQHGPGSRRHQRLSGGFRRAVFIAATRLRATVSGLGDRRLRRRGILPDAVATWCDSIAGRVRGGTTLHEALRIDVPTDRLLSVLTRDVRLGLDRGETLTVAIDRAQHDDRWPADRESGRADASIPGVKDLELALSVLRCAAEIGGSPAAPLDAVAAALRLRSADRQERASHSAQARLSAHVLTVVPLGTLVLFIVTTPQVRSVLTTPIGGSCLLLGLLLNTSGWIWMRSVIGAGT